MYCHKMRKSEELSSLMNFSFHSASLNHSQSKTAPKRKFKNAKVKSNLYHTFVKSTIKKRDQKILEKEHIQRDAKSDIEIGRIIAKRVTRSQREPPTGNEVPSTKVGNTQNKQEFNSSSTENKV